MLSKLLRCLFLGAGVALLDAGGLTAKVTQVIQFCTANLTAADDVDVIDDGRVQREDTLDADAKADLADCHGLACSAVFACDANALKSLQTLFIAFLNADVNAKRVARLKRRDILFKLCLFDNVQSIHFSCRPEVNDRFQSWLSYRVYRFFSTP